MTRRVVLPDGILVELPSEEDYRKLIERYQEEGYEILEQGDLVIITTKPKQASALWWEDPSEHNTDMCEYSVGVANEELSEEYKKICG